MTKLIIFDLDGTLLDTIVDLAVACNAVLAMRGLPQHSLEDYRMFVGNGVMRLVERALPEPLRNPCTVDAARRDFVSYYKDHLDTYTSPYAGIPELLAELQRRGLQLAVASNKFQSGTEELVHRFFPGCSFPVVLGQRPGVPLKPDPAVDLQILQLTGTTPDEALHVGDSAIDVLAARAAGIRSVGVSWGFRSREELAEAGADAIIDRPDGLLNLL